MKMLPHHKALNVAITAGQPDEQHDHDIIFRKTLPHTHDCPTPIVELIPYHPYIEQLNSFFHDAIADYNTTCDQRYAAALSRYHAGETKHRPRPSKYCHMGYDMTSHLRRKARNPQTGKIETAYIYRSCIIYFGSQEDRNRTISDDQAISAAKYVTEQFSAKFPFFFLLGSVLHLDESTAHMHLTYLPFYRVPSPKSGLSIKVSFDRSMEEMGYQPECSVINANLKRPLLFNAFRNILYATVESALAREGIRLQYGEAPLTNPYADPSKRQSLEEYKAIKDLVKDLQWRKNIALTIFSHDELMPEDYRHAFLEILSARDALESVNRCPLDLLNRYHKVPTDLLQHTITATKDLTETLAYTTRQMKTLEDELSETRQKLAALAQKKAHDADEIARLQAANAQLNVSYKSVLQMQIELVRLRTALEKRDKYLSRIALPNGQSALDDFFSRQKKPHTLDKTR